MHVRNLLKKMLRKMLLVLTSFSCVVALAPVANAATKPTFTAGAFLLSVDGSEASLVASVDAGNTVGQVAVVGGGPIPDKQLTGTVLVQPMKIRFAPGTTRALEEWLADGLLPGDRRASGEVKLLDSSGKAVSRRTFLNAGIQQLVIPTLDVASNDPLSLSAVVKPTATTYETDSSGGGKVGSKAAKAVLSSSFRMTVDGLDASGVAKIDAITVTQVLSTSGVPQSVEVSNIIVSLTASTSSAWFTWFDDMIAGGGSNALERDGAIELRVGNAQDVRGTIRLRGLGIVSIGAERADGWVTKKGAAGASERVKVEMYCESVEYVPGV